MTSRNLKYYSWAYEKGFVYLVSKRFGSQGEMKLSMPMADSFVRAYIGFKGAQKLEEKEKLRHQHSIQIVGYRSRMNKLKETISKLKGHETLPAN